MGVLFSAVTLSAGDKQAEFLVAGIPQDTDDLEGWTAYDCFMEKLNSEQEVDVNAQAYIYGEGETVKANPEEIAYFTKRIEMDENFLSEHCDNTSESSFTIIHRRIICQKVIWFYNNKKGERKMNEWERNSKMAEEYRKIYPPGTRLLLINMNDPYAPIPSGTRGTVDHIDDQAQIFMKWDNHRSLPIVPGEDSFRKLTAEELAEEQSSGIDATESGPEMQM